MELPCVFSHIVCIESLHMTYYEAILLRRICWLCRLCFFLELSAVDVVLTLVQEAPAGFLVKGLVNKMIPWTDWNIVCEPFFQWDIDKTLTICWEHWKEWDWAAFSIFMKPVSGACNIILVEEVGTLLQLCLQQRRGFHRPVSVQLQVTDPQVFSKEACHLWLGKVATY